MSKKVFSILFFKESVDGLRWCFCGMNRIRMTVLSVVHNLQVTEVASPLGQKARTRLVSGHEDRC